jgi:hypothetical protein
MKVKKTRRICVFFDAFRLLITVGCGIIEERLEKLHGLYYRSEKS